MVTMTLLPLLLALALRATPAFGPTEQRAERLIDASGGSVAAAASRVRLARAGCGGGAVARELLQPAGSVARLSLAGHRSRAAVQRPLPRELVRPVELQRAPVFQQGPRAIAARVAGLPRSSRYRPRSRSRCCSWRTWVIRITSSGIAFLVLVFLIGRLAEGLAPGYGGLALVSFRLGTLVAPFAAVNFAELPLAAFGFGAFLLAWKGRRCCRCARRGRVSWSIIRGRCSSFSLASTWRSRACVRSAVTWRVPCRLSCVTRL